MGTKVDCKSYLRGFYSMRDLNENSSSNSWPVFYGDTVSNGPYYNGFVPRTLVDRYGHDKDTLKQKMLEHEAVFKNQVCELHRLYRIQRDMMEEVKRKEVHDEYRASMEPASSSSHHGSQVPLHDPRKWHMAGFPLFNSSYGRTPIVGAENLNSPISCTKGIVSQLGQSPFQNGSTSKDSEALDSRPSKVRKKLFDLQLPADQYVDPEDEENLRDYKECDVSSYAKTNGPTDASASTSRLTGLADLNEPIQIEEETGPLHQPAKTTAGYFGVTGGAMFVRDGFSINSSTESRANEKGWFSHLNKPGYQLGKLPLASHTGKHTYPNGYNREDMWREGFRQGVECSRSYHHSNNGLEPTASQNPGSYLFSSSSSFASSWAHPVSSWAKPKLNGFYHASAAGSKELHTQSVSAGFDYLNCARVDNVASVRSTNHGFPKDQHRTDSKPVIDINLNEALPESPLNETLVPQDGTGEPEDSHRTLPWLKPNGVHVNEVLNACRSEKVRSFETDVPENRRSSKMVDNERRKGIIDINVACEPDEQISDEEPVPEKVKSGPSVKEYFDLNSCVSDYEDPPYEQKSLGVKITLDIDLEAPVFLESEDEDSTLSKSLENKHEQIQDDDFLKSAAEALVSISSCPKFGVEDSIRLPTESSMEAALLLLVDALSSCESRIPETSEEVDDFEAMTLQLAETREDCMPKPFVPETLKSEETVPNALTTRTRRGNSRRGRQRRDFQRDILPGLTSLSRHEVTEDIQTFGGLMRATGHSWTSGLARRNGARNGGGRGRRRAVVETVPPAIQAPVCAPLIKTVESGLEDRSLTGWGKTTRRPRRQRCPAGNPPTAVLT